MKEGKISVQHHSVRLFHTDNLHLTKKVKEFRFDDKRFENNGAALRYYVHLGIAAEKRTATANSLDDTIIKTSQKEVITDSLLPVKTSIDDLINVMKAFEKKQEQYFTESLKDNDKLARKFESSNELHENNHKEILDQLNRAGSINQEALRNAIILRSIMSVFLLGYKTGRITPDDRTSWEKLVPFVIKKAQELSTEEIQAVAEGERENAIVAKLANDLWKHIKDITPQQ